MVIFFWITLLGLLLLIPTAYAGLIGAPYAPTRRQAIIDTFDHIKLSSSDYLVDLGAGDGVVLRFAAMRGAKALGYELSPIMWFIAFLRLLAFRPQARIKYGNFFHASLPAETTVIFAFLMPEHMAHLRQYLATQNLPHARYLLSYMFPFPHLQPLHMVRSPRAGHVYIYDLEQVIAN